MLALIRISSDLIGSLDEPEVIQRVLTEAGKIVGAESCALILLDETLDECFFYGATGPQQQTLEKIRFGRHVGIAGRVLDSGQPALVADTQREPNHYRGVDRKTGVETKSLLCVPLKAGDRTIGVVEAVNKLRAPAFDDDDLQILTLFANLAAAALRNARVFGRCHADLEACKLAAPRSRIYLGDSPAMIALWDTVGKVALTQATVLITGESGSGKEEVAAAIHRRSDRAQRPFVCVNCAALEANLLSSELFGHEKGAFTGAAARRVGRFEMAHQGTLFLDEIADIEPAVQARLLRVLETHSFERLGSSETLRTDVRVVAATNANLGEAVQAGRFRADLYHRLNVIPIRVPALRERREDIPGLLRFFAEYFARDMKIRSLRFTDEAVRVLTAYAWPGNVRELKNFVERLAVLAGDSEVTPALIFQLCPLMQTPAQPSVQTPAAVPDETRDASNSLWEREKQAIVEALAAHHGNRSAAARALGIDRHHIRYRMKKYGIEEGS